MNELYISYISGKTKVGKDFTISGVEPLPKTKALRQAFNFKASELRKGSEVTRVSVKKVETF